MEFTTPIGNTTVLACFSLIVIGKFEDLDSVARLIVSTLQDVQITATEYPVGWRLQLTCKNEATLASCYSLVNDWIQSGMPVQIANRDPMPTRIYSVQAIAHIGA